MSNTTRVLYIICYYNDLVENDYVSAFIILGHLQVVCILFQGKLYNACSVMPVSLIRHDYKGDLVLSKKTYIIAYFIGI